MDVFMGTILPFAFNFPPNGWQTCSGQIVSLNQNQALFALLGTVFGGDGITTFGLPNLSGRVPISQGTGVGLTNRVIGEFSGLENITLTQSNLPIHTHAVATTALTVNTTVQVAGTGTGQTAAPGTSNTFLGASTSGGPGAANIWSTVMNGPINMGGVASTVGGSVTVQPAGQSQPTPLMNPFLVLNFCIAMQGIFPTRQ